LGEYAFSFIPENVLPSNTTITFSTQVKLRKVATGEIANDTLAVVTFTTDEGLDYIPISNVAYSYPMEGQLNVYPGESPKGYIKLKKGQPELFDQPIHAYFESASGASRKFPVSYDDSNKEVTFPIVTLSKGRGYRLTLASGRDSGESSGGGNDTNAPSNTTTPMNGDIGGGTSRGGGPNGINLFEPSYPAVAGFTDSLHSLHFRISNYATFQDKIDAVIASKEFGSNDYTIQIEQVEELFGTIELGGGLIGLEVPENNPWFEQNQFNRKYYQYLPDEMADISLENPNRPEDWGKVPTNAVYILTDENSRLVTAGNWQQDGPNLQGSVDTFKLGFPALVRDDILHTKAVADQLLNDWAFNEKVYMETFWNGINDDDPTSTPEMPEWTVHELRDKILENCVGNNRCFHDPRDLENSCPNFTGNIPCDDIPDWIPDFLDWLSLRNPDNPLNPTNGADGYPWPVKFTYSLPGKGTTSRFTVSISSASR
ncbi:MAG: hypothetical protein AAFQ37_12965, partial [Bacteroidota bacterium]